MLSIIMFWFASWEKRNHSRSALGKNINKPFHKNNSWTLRRKSDSENIFKCSKHTNIFVFVYLMCALLRTAFAYKLSIKTFCQPLFLYFFSVNNSVYQKYVNDVSKHLREWMRHVILDFAFWHDIMRPAKFQLRVCGSDLYVICLGVDGVESYKTNMNIKWA